MIVLAMTNYHLGWCAAAELETLPPRDWLSPEELGDFEAISSPKRRRDRLAGRVAAKRALAEHFREELGWNPAPRELPLSNDEAGRPVLRLAADVPAPSPSFSISHSEWGGVCAVATSGARVGCDLESIAARPREVLAFVASPDELAGASPGDPAAQTRLWTGKEAVLKLLGLGLDAGPRMVEVRAGGAEVRLGGVPAERWRALGRPRITVDFTTRGGSLVAVARTGG